MELLWHLALSLHFLLFFHHSLFSSFPLTNCLTMNHSTTNIYMCHEDESNALLKFKESFVISKSASQNPFSHPKTASWIPTTDCCSSWHGVECDDLTGHVTGIDLSSSQLYGSVDGNSTLFSLVHLQSLDLSDNDFNHSQIPSRTGELSQLRHLNLSQTTFSGEVPHEFSQLPSLLSLDLRSYITDDPINHLRLKTTTLRSLIQNSTRLKELHLSFVTISSFVPNILTNLTHLEQLSLSHCELYGEFPIGVFHLPKLRVLDLEYNNNLTGMLPDFHSSSLISLLNLKGTSFYGSLPASIANLNSLYWLSISNCSFYGSIPSSIGNLTQLEYFNLGYNKISGEIPYSIGNLTNLAHLSLFENNLSGEIPRSLFGLENLETLVLGNNLLKGQVELEMFLKLKVLTDLDISSNNLVLTTRKRSSNLTLPPIQALDLDSCNLSGEIPSWIMNLTALFYLSLQQNNLQGEIPLSLFRLENLESLSLSNNLLEGQIDLKMFLNLKSLNFLTLGHNNLSLLSGTFPINNATLPPLEVLDLVSCNVGEFPVVIRELDALSYLDVSYNDVKSLPNWICNLKLLVYLDLFYNNLSSHIPSCIGNFSQSLQALMLQGNKLVGRIPQTYTIGSALKMIDLSENNLQGQLPRALVNCRMLEYLNVGHNHINDSFPFWLSTLPELKVISLRHNEFYGPIMCPKPCTFSKLHILDFSHNKFSGILTPEMIESWKSMMMSNARQLAYENNVIKFSGKSWSIYIDYAFTMSNKGIVMTYNELQHLYYMVAIDLSSNRISGIIPDVMGELRSLVLLNLSNNMLSGNIPSSLRKLSNLEALDFSLNNLSGNIPQQLTELTFLEFFDVSFNNLSGPIPENGQFSTFQENSFEGNQGLCGIQLLIKKCENHGMGSPPQSDGDHDSGSLVQFFFFFGLGSLVQFDWKIILIGYVGGLVAGLSLGNAFGPNVLAWLRSIFKRRNLVF